MTYFVIVAIIVIIGYLILHNKKKVQLASLVYFVDFNLRLPWLQLVKCKSVSPHCVSITNPLAGTAFCNIYCGPPAKVASTRHLWRLAWCAFCSIYCGPLGEGGWYSPTLTGRCLSPPSEWCSEKTAQHYRHMDISLLLLSIHCNSELFLQLMGYIVEGRNTGRVRRQRPTTGNGSEYKPLKNADEVPIGRTEEA